MLQYLIEIHLQNSYLEGSSFRYCHALLFKPCSG
jgi:hypothetical protein